MADTVRIPVIRFSGLNPPEETGEVSVISNRIGHALAVALGNEPVAADTALEVLAVWVARLIAVHPSTREHLAVHFARALDHNLRGLTDA